MWSTYCSKIMWSTYCSKARCGALIVANLHGALILPIVTFNINHHPSHHHEMNYPCDFKSTSKEGVAFQLQKLHFCKKAKGLFRFCLWAFEKLNSKTNLCWRNWLQQAHFNYISLIMLFVISTFIICTQFAEGGLHERLSPWWDLHFKLNPR